MNFVIGFTKKRLSIYDAYCLEIRRLIDKILMIILNVRSFFKLCLLGTRDTRVGKKNPPLKIVLIPSVKQERL